jgi:DNA-binding NarL/FixJ family response regulator
MTVPSEARVLVADDHPLVLNGLRKVLERQPDFRVVAHAADGNEAVAHALSHDIELAILDISMPRKSGLEAAREIIRLKPDVRVLIVSMYDDPEYILEAIRLGASGYVLKTAADTHLVCACRAVMRGEPFVHPSGGR